MGGGRLARGSGSMESLIGDLAAGAALHQLALVRIRPRARMRAHHRLPPGDVTTFRRASLTRSGAAERL